MKTEIIIVFVIFLFVNFVIGYSTYGAPTEFGNLTNTTCFIGGDKGIVNCTGDIISGGIFVGNASSAVDDIWVNETRETGNLELVGNLITRNINATAANFSGNVIGKKNITLTSGWFRGLFNWTIISRFLSFDGANLDWNETLSNKTYLKTDGTNNMTGDLTGRAINVSGINDSGNLIVLGN